MGNPPPPKLLVDLTPPPPRPERRAHRFSVTVSAPTAPPVPRRPRRWGRIAAATLTLAILIAAALYGVGIADLRARARESGARIGNELSRARAALQNLSPAQARGAFGAIREELRAIGSRAEELKLFSLAELLAPVRETFRTIPATFRHLIGLSETAVALAASLEELAGNGFAWFAGGEGSRLITEIEKLRDLLSQAIAESTALRNAAPSALEGALGEPFLPLRVELETAHRFASALALWLRSAEPRRLLILFQNPSELRPAGGFIGSYAEVTIQNAGLQETRVWDIYDPDGQLKERIVPPRELQFITSRWGSRDANWFFDFPTASRKVRELLEQSEIYRERNVQFDGAVAMNVSVFKTLLEVIGPIPLPDYDLVITPENFLQEIQREVESGEGNRAGEPKRILKALFPLVLERLGWLDGAARERLARGIRNHLNRKDILASFTDPELQGYLARFGISGAISELPERFTGTYLAAVVANVGGGKTDAVTRQRLALNAALDASGRIEHELTLTRAHGGRASDDPWYRVPSRSYVKIFVPPGSRLQFADGGELRKPPERDYEGFTEDRDLAALAATRKPLPEFNVEEVAESGRTVFGTWLTVPRGEERTLTLHYEGPATIALGEAPAPYTFIFEKQSGLELDLSLTFEAPPGYIWQESNSPIFSARYEPPLPARIELPLTFVKLR